MELVKSVMEALLQLTVQEDRFQVYHQLRVIVAGSSSMLSSSPTDSRPHITREDRERLHFSGG